MIRLTTITGILTLTTFAEVPIKGVDLKLISSVKSISPGASFTVGLQIHHHPGFHTYWKNPGAVGYPITIDWKLPPDFVAGPIRWPVPEMSDMAGNPVFGYQSDATLLVDLVSPAQLPDTQVKIQAITSWMACSNECYPGNKTFTLTLPVTEELASDSRTASIFSNAEKKIPRELQGWTANIESNIESNIDEKDIRLLLTPPTELTNIGTFRFYSSDGQISSDPDPAITNLDDGRIRIAAKRARFSPKKAASLPFVLVSDKPLSPSGALFGTLNPSYPNHSSDENAQTP